MLPQGGGEESCDIYKVVRVPQEETISDKQ